MPIRIVLLFKDVDILGSQGTLPILLEICNNILVRIDVNPFFASVVVIVICVSFGFYDFSENFLIVL
jgi:hypothetical protein